MLPSRQLSGVLFALVAALLLSTSDALVKILVKGLPVSQTIFMQLIFACGPFVVAVLARGWRSIAIKRPVLVFIRGALGGVGPVFGFYAFSILPLAEVYAIVFCTPVVVTLASIPVLRETVGLHRWTAAVFGLRGSSSW